MSTLTPSNMRTLPYEKEALGLMSSSCSSAVTWSDEDKRTRGCSGANAVLTRSVQNEKEFQEEGSHFVATLVYHARIYTTYMYCMVTHIARVSINRVRLPILHVVS